MWLAATAKRGLPRGTLSHPVRHPNSAPLSGRLSVVGQRILRLSRALQLPRELHVCKLPLCDMRFGYEANVQFEGSWTDLGACIQTELLYYG